MDNSSNVNHSNIWEIHFDGARSMKFFWVGIVFTSPKNELILHSYKLKFDCTNNVVKYQTLLLSLKLAREMKLKALKVVGDYDLIVQQVRNQCLAPKLILLYYTFYPEILYSILYYYSFLPSFMSYSIQNQI